MDFLSIPRFPIPDILNAIGGEGSKEAKAYLTQLAIGGNRQLWVEILSCAAVYCLLGQLDVMLYQRLYQASPFRGYAISVQYHGIPLGLDPAVITSLHHIPANNPITYQVTEIDGTLVNPVR